MDFHQENLKGYVILTVPNKLQPDGPWLFKKMMRVGYTQKEFTPGEIRGLFETNGLSVEETFGLDCFYFAPTMLLTFLGKGRGGAAADSAPGSKTLCTPGLLARANNKWLRIVYKVNRNVRLPASASLLYGLVGRKR